MFLLAVITSITAPFTFSAKAEESFLSNVSISGTLYDVVTENGEIDVPFTYSGEIPYTSNGIEFKEFVPYLESLAENNGAIDGWNKTQFILDLKNPVEYSSISLLGTGVSTSFYGKFLLFDTNGNPYDCTWEIGDGDRYWRLVLPSVQNQSNILIDKMVMTWGGGIDGVYVTLRQKSIVNYDDYTDVLTDLTKDEKFDVTAYPANPKDYSLKVIQIAESINKELFIYVYQPSNSTIDLIATEIRLSTPVAGAVAEVYDYPLTLLSTNTVFDKYKVEGLTVKDDSVRYYDITAIFRAFNANIDSESGTDNTIDYVSFNVGQVWTVYTLDDNVVYSYTYGDTIIVTDKWCGTIRYDDNLNLFEKEIDSHFVAFTTDRKIEKLLQAKVTYVAQKEIFYNNTSGIYYENDGEPYPGEANLSYTDVSINEVGGIFNRTYEWNRIQSVSEFKESENLSSSAITNLDGKEWVLRFFESEYDFKGSVLYSYEEHYTAVKEVSILQLTFETDGKSYTLGVVDNKSTPDTNPDGEEQPLFDFTDEFEKIMALLLVVLLVAVFMPFLAPIISSLFMFILKGILNIIKISLKIVIFIITLPLRPILWLLKKK